MAQDETVASIETDKVTIPVNAPSAGQITHHFAKEGDTVQVGSELFKYDPDKVPEKSSTKEPTTPSQSGRQATDPSRASTKSTEAPKSFAGPSTIPSGADTILRPATEPLRPPNQGVILEKAEQDVGKSHAPPSKSLFVIPEGDGKIGREEHRERLTRMRSRIAERMKQSQNTAASLTTFNEVDMSALMGLRNRYKEEFLKRHGVKFGFMSPFVKAAATALREIPVVNARLDAEAAEIIYHDYVDISIAVATPKGLVTPVLRNCERMSVADIERTIQELGDRARENKIALEELSGGTFTISNGGVFGSLMGTPIINVPQSAILGMHAIKERPVVVEGGKIEARPMMYIALTYDHRLVDGREAVSFLIRLKQLLEDPQRFLLNL